MTAADHSTSAAPGIPNLDASFDPVAARDAVKRYEDMTDAEYIYDQSAFTKAYAFAAHRSARHLHAAILEIEQVAERAADAIEKSVLKQFAAEAQLERQAPVIEAMQAILAAGIREDAAYAPQWSLIAAAANVLDR